MMTETMKANFDKTGATLVYNSEGGYSMHRDLFSVTDKAKNEDGAPMANVQPSAVAVPSASPAATATVASSAVARAPKEPKTGYNFFCDMRRPQLLVEFPEAKPAEISKMLGEGWKQLNTAELRAPYQLQASNDRARFAKECA